MFGLTNPNPNKNQNNNNLPTPLFQNNNNPPTSLFTGTTNNPSLLGGSLSKEPTSLFGKPASSSTNTGLFTSTLFAQPSAAPKQSKGQQSKPKINPAFSFFATTQANQQKQQDKKHQIPQQSSLFPPSTLFVNNKSEGTDTNKMNTMQTSLFANKPEVSPSITVQSTKEDKPTLKSGLFSNIQQTSLFPSKPAQTQNQIEKPVEVKNQILGNLSNSSGQPLFSSSAFVIDKKNQALESEQKASQNKQSEPKKSLFSGSNELSGRGQMFESHSLFSYKDKNTKFQPTQNKPLFDFTSTANKQADKKTENKGLLFSNIKVPENKITLSFAKTPPQQGIPNKAEAPKQQPKPTPIEQSKKPLGSLFSQPLKKTDQKTIQTNPALSPSSLGPSLFKKTEEKQKKEDDSKSSLFAQPIPKKKKQQEQSSVPTFAAFKNETLTSNEIPNKSNKVSQNLSTNLPSTTRITNLQSDAAKTLPGQPQKIETERNQTNLVHSNTIGDKHQQKVPPTLSAKTAYEQPPQSFISKGKPKEFNADTFIDFNKLKRERNSQSSEYYLIEKRAFIVQSIKVYLSMGKQQHRIRQANPNESEKGRFFSDLTGLFIKLDQLDGKYYQIYMKFVRNVLKQVRLQQKLFIDDKWNYQHFGIYTQNYSGQQVLNQLNVELKYIFQKIIAKWYIDKINYLNFIMTNPDFIRPKEDLYSHMLTYLLRLQLQQQLNQEKSPFKTIVRDYHKVLIKKLVDLLHHFNRKLGKNYKNLLTEQPQRYLVNIIPMIERLKSQTTITLCLRIILNSINLTQPQKIDKNLVKIIRESKSGALLPLRVILTKLKDKKLDFAPNPKDLYRYVNGDQWVDWIDCYLSAGDKSNFELNLQEASYLVQALNTLSGSVLIDRLINNKKGIYKFFDLLKDQNLIEYYYRILECCLYNQESIKEIDEFYFKKTYLSTQYQQIKQYIVNYTENITKPIQEKLSEENVVTTLYPKISLLTTILEIEPTKIFDLQKYIFDPEFSRHKKVHIAGEIQPKVRQGQKLVHLLIDVINIISHKCLDTRLLAKIFKVLTALLKNKKTEQITVKAMYINRPSFYFIDRAQLPKQTNEALILLLDHIINSSYLYDLIIQTNLKGEQSLTAISPFYPIRYNDIEYNRFLSSGQQIPNSFSIFWINKLFVTASKQKFNPALLQKVLAKLNIPPSPIQEEKENMEYGVKRYRRCERKIPQVFQMIINLANSFPIWQEITKVLDYKVYFDEGNYKLKNMFSARGQEVGGMLGYHFIFSSLKLLRTVFTLNQMLINNQITNPTHFMTKTLSELRVLSRIEVTCTMSLNQRGNILLGLLSNIQTQQPLYNDTLQKIAWQVEYEQEESTRFQMILEYVNRNKLMIDYQQIINIYKNPQNIYYQSVENVSTLSLDCMIYFLRLGYADNYLQVSMMNSLNYGQQQKIKIRNDFLAQLKTTLAFYFSEDEYKCIKYKLLQFIYDLKYNVGKNYINQALADQLFTDYLNLHKNSHHQFGNETRVNYIMIRYLQKDLKLNSEKFDNSIEQITQTVIHSFELKDSYSNRHQPIKDTSQIGNILLKYHQKEYSFYTLNQMERILDEKAIVEVGLKLQTLHFALQILMKQVVKKKYSHYLSVALNSINKVIAQYNLVLIVDDIPFEYFNLVKSQSVQIQTRQKQPRQFLRDPLELFLAQGKSLQQKRDIQMFQKNNIVQWFMQICQTLSQRLSVYLQFALTINRTFYSNNPIDFTLTKQDQNIKNIFCHLSVGITPLSAIQIFGKSEPEAVAVIQLISQNLISRLINLYQLIKQSVVPNTHDTHNYLQAVKLLGFCLQWLRNQKKGEQSGANEVVRKLSRNYQILLPVGQKTFIKEQLKLIQSYLSIGLQVPNHIKFDIQYHIFQLLNQYHKSIDSVEIQDKSEELGFLSQQAFTLLIICPPASNQHEIHKLLVSIWSKQRNQGFFFNESRLILELASLYPEEIAKLKILTKYQISSALRPAQERYQNGERLAQSMKWIWVLHITTALVSSSDSVLVIDQVSNFVNKNKLQLYKTLEANQKRITRAYAQELEATLNLFSILLCNGLWITRNESILEEITYIMSHHLIKYFVGIAQRKIVVVAQSNNQKALFEARLQTFQEDNDMTQESHSEQSQNIFELQLKIKIIYCLRFYFIAMQIAFFKSHYIQKYFNNCVFGTNKYLTSFWDTFSKDLIVLFNYTLNRTQEWLKMNKAKKLIQMLNNCYNAPSTFIQNAFLTSIIQLPQSDSEIFSDLYLLCFLVTKLAVTHYVRMTTYLNKFNALLTTDYNKFAKRIKEHIIQMGELSKRLGPSCQSFVSYQNFRKQAEILDSRTPLK